MLGVPATPQAVRLLHDGIRVLSEMTCNGFPVDIAAVKKNIETCATTRKKIEEEAWSIPGGSEWKRRYASSATLSNVDQAKDIFFGFLGFSPETDDADAEASDSLDKDVLADIDHPLADLVSRYRKLDKCEGTFLKALLVETVDGYCHPFFSLSRARSYRSSSTDPNGQNFPVRDPETASFVRTAIKAPPGYRLVECDYSGIEVLVAACYHHDPTMIDYLASGYDMHRDMAAECYLLDRDDAQYWKDKRGKKTRYSSKNGFVFPEFYGSYWNQVAVSLWKNISRLDLRAPDDQPLSSHLKRHGIKGLGTVEKDSKGRPHRGTAGSFYRHVEEVEKRFWGQRFPQYAEWRKTWHSNYQKKGHFQSLTGFNYSGVFRRNQVINLPVQGSASHLKLQACINLLETLRARKIDARLILEIHDSIIGLVHESCFDEYMEIVAADMVERINAMFDWLVVPVKIEVEASPSGESWHAKQAVALH